MFRWLKEKALKSKIYMCTKELLWDLENSKPEKIATILALSAFFRETLLRELGISNEKIENPKSLSFKESAYCYEVLENVRNENELQMRGLKLTLNQMGISYPEFAEEHAKLCKRGLEVLMVTIGVGVTNANICDVSKVWGILHKSQAYLDLAIDNIKSTEAENIKILGGDLSQSIYIGIDVDEWKEVCQFQPGVAAHA